MELGSAAGRTAAAGTPAGVAVVPGQLQVFGRIEWAFRIRDYPDPWQDQLGLGMSAGIPRSLSKSQDPRSQKSCRRILVSREQPEAVALYIMDCQINIILVGS